ncbi:pilus assembly PilX family protein [Legionella bononiensis]|uniref:Pilus assembly protein n=1 Tax=Legionella bononiensis TaxID=2793102 RepID=A0ABS1WAI2_9GAMM|nr:pilus assembly protein [Legionella bononiensis]MBL7480398.1 pilus assembly protein [Legionella bononiensis]MBL7526370.1 pilus assembly protein [Legionella bononiensis]MBL7563136.1 pilus assembly protein [Legionella bononiensis]
MNTLSSLTQLKQKGYILITTLVLMSMLTMMGLTQSSHNTTQTRVATNATDSEISFEKTEGALNEAVNKILNATYTTQNFLNNTNGLYLFDSSTTPIWKTVNWSSSSAVINSFQGGSGTQSSYIIEQLPSVIQPGQNMKSPTHVYRITARSVGSNGTSSVLIQSTIQLQQ